jgi:hypothetical protein
MASTRSSWFARSSQQGVSAKIATFPALAKSGPVPVLIESKPTKTVEEKYFVVGKTKIGGEEIVGHER